MQLPCAAVGVGGGRSASCGPPQVPQEDLNAKKRDRCLWLGNGLSYVQPSASGSGLSSRESYFSSFAENVYKI